MRLGLGLGLGTALSSNAPLVIPAYANYLSDEFETGNALILDRPNWTAPDFAGTRGDLSNSDPNYWRVDSVAGVGGFLHLSSASKNTTTPIAMYFGASQFAAVNDISVDFGYDTSGIKSDGSFEASPSFGRLRIWQLDANNYLQVQIDATNSRLSIDGKVAGVALTQTYWHKHGVSTGVGLLSFKTRGILHVEIKNYFMRISLDGVWLTPDSQHAFPFDVLNMTALSQRYDTASKNKGPVGILGSSKQNALSQYIRVKPADVQVTFNHQFVGRDSTTATGGTATVEMTYTGTPVTWVSRLLSYPDNTVVVQDWAALSGVSAAAGSATATRFLPIGGPYTIEIGFIGNDGLLHTALSRPCYSGYIVGISGQSNANGRGTGAYSGTYIANGGAAQLVNINGSNPQQTLLTGSGATKAQTREFASNESCYPLTQFPSSYVIATYLTGLLSAPVAVQTIGADGTSIFSLTDSTDTRQQDIIAGFLWTPGIWEGMLWDQGEANADQTTDNATGYATRFINNLLPQMRASNTTKNTTMPVVISLVGRYATTGSTVNSVSGATVEPFREKLRQQFIACTAAGGGDSRTYLSDSKLGGVHPSANPYHYGGNYDELNRRSAYSIAKYIFGLNVYDGRGPLITGATRSGAVITLTFDMNGAATLVYKDSGAGSTGDNPASPVGQSNTLYGYQVSADGFTTNLPISTIAVGGDNVSLVITLASDPGGPVAIRSYYGWDYNDEKLFWGTGYADGRADIPVFPLFRNGTQLTSN